MSLSRTFTCCRSTSTVIVSPSAMRTTLPSRLPGVVRRTQVRRSVNIRSSSLSLWINRTQNHNPRGYP